MYASSPTLAGTFSEEVSDPIFLIFANMSIVENIVLFVISGFVIAKIMMAIMDTKRKEIKCILIDFFSINKEYITNNKPHKVNKNAILSPVINTVNVPMNNIKKYGRTLIEYFLIGLKRVAINKKRNVSLESQIPGIGLSLKGPVSLSPSNNFG